MKLVLFSDVHHGAPEGGVHKGIKRKLTQHAMPLVEKLILEINKLSPDAVMNLGDLIDDTFDHDRDLVYLNSILSELKAINAPLYNVIGNHDIQTLDRAEAAAILSPGRGATYAFDLGGYHFVILGICSLRKTRADGTIEKVRYICDEDLRWLTEDIKKNKNTPSLVFIHHGLAEDTMAGNWWFQGDPNGPLLHNRADVKRIMHTDKNLLAVFSGHQHWTKSIIENGLTYYLIGSLTEDINGNGIPDGVWFELDLEGRSLRLIEHHLEV